MLTHSVYIFDAYWEEVVIRIKLCSMHGTGYSSVMIGRVRKLQMQCKEQGASIERVQRVGRG